MSKNISIPHWFYSNKTVKLWFLSTMRFQYHTGSIQTKMVISTTTTGITFQYHTGSIQTFIIRNLENCTVEFQYHTGSIQTNIKEAIQQREERFQYHTGSIQTEMRCMKKNWKQTHFNTTLVLFKRGFLAASEKSHDVISIPHWFYSNIK